MYGQSYFSGDFTTHTLKYVKKLLILQTISISAKINVDFIPSFIQEWNFDPSLHDSESTYCIIPDRVFNPEWKME